MMTPRRLLSALTGAALACAAAAHAPAQPAPADAPAAAAGPTPLTAEQWREDLRILVETISTKHKNAFFKVSRESFNGAAAALAERIPSLEPHQVAIGLMQLAAMVGDGHTLVAGDSGSLKFRYYPLAFHWFSDGARIVATPAEHAPLRGLRVAAIGEMPIEQAIERVSTVFPFENESQLRQTVVRQLNNAAALHATGVTPGAGSAVYVLRGDDEAETRLELEAIPQDALPTIETMKVPDGSRPEGGYTRFIGQRRREFYWFAPQPEHRLLYVRYDRCADDTMRHSTVAAFADELLAYVDGHATEIERLVIDLRRNGGGNSALLRPLISGLRERRAGNPPWTLFVLIGRGTFSSGQLNAHELRRDAKAILIGEPTGQKPNAYGEVMTFTLPHSGIHAQYSTKYFHTDDTDPPSMMPDVLVEVSFAEFAAGRDPVMEHVFNWRGGASPE